MRTDHPTYTVDASCVADTLDMGHRLGESLQPGIVVTLIGTLGSGKTHFVKGVARGNQLPVDLIASSPTFVLVNEYPGKLHLYHIDAYRLRSYHDLEAIGIDEICDGGGATFIEWADRVPECIPPEHLQVEISITGEQTRQLTFTPKGVLAKKICQSMFKDHDAVH